MKRVVYHLCLIIIPLFVISGCESSKKTPEKITKKNPWKTLTIPSFNSDSAYHFIEKQVAFGPRVPNTMGHKLCGDYLIAKLREYGANVTVQPFVDVAYNGQPLQLRNIIGSFSPTTRKRILLAAHWDTRPYADKDTVDRDFPIDGANDGASGVGVLLELARTVHRNGLPKTGFDIVFFDGEDYGEHDDMEQVPLKNNRMHIWWCLGSQYWARNPHVPKYSAYYGILLDMVGAKNAKFYKEGGSMQFAPKVTKKVWNTARSLGHSNFFINALSPGVTDDHIFVNRDARIPMINIIDYDSSSPSYYFPDYHHTHRDNLSLIDKQTLQAVGETLLYLVYTE